MKSKTLSAKLIWDNAKKQIWIFAVLLLAFLFIYPISTVSAFDRWRTAGIVTYQKVFKSYLTFIQTGLSQSGMVLVVAGAMASGVFGFWYLHSRQKLDFYHSLPIRREKLYWNQVITGFLFYLVPEVLSAVLCLCVGAAQGYFTLKIAGAMAEIVLLHMLLFFMVYGTTILAMLLTGRLLVGVLGSVAFLVYVPGLVELIRHYADKFLDTFSMFYDYDMGMVSVRWYSFTSPINWFAYNVNKIITGGKISPLEILLAAVVGILLLVLNLWIYKKRPFEETGRTMAFGWVGKLVKFFVEIPISMLAGYLACSVGPSNQKMFWWVAGLVIGLVLIHGVMEIIYEVDFRKFFAHKAELGIEAVLVAIFVSIFLFDLTGYDKYLPKQEELAYVSINQMNLSGESKMLIYEDENGELSTEYSTSKIMDLMKLEADDSLYELLQGMVDRQISFQWKERDRAQEEKMEYLSLVYTLKNGRKVTRYYEFTLDEEIQSQLDDLWNRQDFRKGMYPNFAETSKFLKSISVSNFGDVQEVYPANDEKRFELVDALWADIQDADKNTYMERPIGMLYFYYGSTQEYIREYPYQGEYEEVLIYPGYSRVLEVLEKKGISMKRHLDAEDVISMEIVDQEDMETGVTTIAEYTTKEQFEKLLPYLQYNEYWSFQLPDKDYNIRINVVWKDHNGSPITSDFYFAKGEIPEEFQKK